VSPLTLDEIVTRLDARLARAPRAQAQRLASLRFRLSGEGGGDLYVAVGNGLAMASERQGPLPVDCTIRLSVTDAEDLLEGRLDAVKGYFSGRIRISGDMGQAMRLGDLLSV
jgi:putative sterol carrier protein